MITALTSSQDGCRPCRCVSDFPAVVNATFLALLSGHQRRWHKLSPPPVISSSHSQSFTCDEVVAISHYVVARKPVTFTVHIDWRRLVLGLFRFICTLQGTMNNQFHNFTIINFNDLQTTSQQPRPSLVEASSIFHATYLTSLFAFLVKFLFYST